jgi:hypothetical protein
LQNAPFKTLQRALDEEPGENSLIILTCCGAGILQKSEAQTMTVARRDSLHAIRQNKCGAQNPHPQLAEDGLKSTA